MTLDLTKPVQTRDGNKVRIVCTDADVAVCRINQPIVGTVNGLLCSWGIDGKYNPSEADAGDMDLINVPPKKTKVQVEVRLYRVDRGLFAHAKSGDSADRWDPYLGDVNLVSSTTIEMEYEEQS